MGASRIVTPEQQAEAGRACEERHRQALKRLSKALGIDLGTEAIYPGRMANAIKAVLDDRGLETLKRQKAILERLLEITNEGIAELEALRDSQDS
jgi:hypothetical protein